MSLLRSNGSRGGLLVVLLALAVLWTTTAAATVMLYADLGRLVELSDVIVQGRVVDQQTFFDEQANEVATITTVEVDKTYLGDVGKTVKFRQWGGEWGDKLSRIPGDAQFDPYETAVIFLADGKGKFAGMRYLVSLGQSKYRVVRTGDNAFVTRDLTDLAFLNQETDEIHPRGAERYEIDAFEAELESLVAGIKGGKR